ncbi:MAG TPA: hypothetical protein EYG34_04115 [Acidimicrobiia bacterium]|jgi:hypothetical protein|nr:hypothetical protein [Acidimicrobiia bacterium]HIL46286.1 hypothetical protein [Acidimicrobiia bacterium]
MTTFDNITETDQEGTERQVTLEITATSIVRSTEDQTWVGRLDAASVESLDRDKKMIGADSIVAHTSFGEITWSLKKGQGLFNALEDACK